MFGVGLSKLVLVVYTVIMFTYQIFQKGCIKTY